MLQEKRIEYLLEVVKERNITQAAQNVYISQPALSRIIINIEKKIGTDIFVRSNEGLTLTPEGEKYIEGCIRALNMYRSAIREIEDMKEAKRCCIILGITTQMGLYLLPKILDEFKISFPRVQLCLVEERLDIMQEMVRTGKIDVALVYSSGEPDLNYIYLGNDPIYLMAPPYYYQKQEHWSYGFENAPVVLSSLLEADFILLKKGRGMRAITDVLFDQHAMWPNVVFETESINLAHVLVQNNQGFTFIARTAARLFDNTSPGVYYPVSGLALKRTLFMCTRQGEYLPHSTRFLIDLLGNALAE